MTHEPAAREMAACGPEVEFTDITTIRGDEPVLTRLRLRLPPGRRTVLMGPSGSGKTTLVRHLVGLLPPDRGAVQVGGHSVWDLAPAELVRLRRNFGVMLGGSTLFDASVFGSLSVFDNVAYPLRLRPIDIDDDLVAARIYGQLRAFGLEEVADRLPGELGARTRRRMAVAAALIADAPLVVLDDPDSGMDSVHRERMQQAIIAAHQRSSGTFLVTTHDIGLARAVGEHLAILCNGRIVAQGPPAELLDGVHDGEEFDRRFRIRDHMGPPGIEEARALTRGRERWLVFDPLLAAFFVILAAVLLLLLLYARSAGSPISF